MLHEFLEALYENEKKASAEDELTEMFKRFPLEEIPKVATVVSSVNPKQACHLSGDGHKWLTQFQGTPLYEQAVALEEEELQAEAADIERRIASRQNENTWDKKDMVTLRKRMLDLELSKLKAQGMLDQEEDEEEEEEEEAAVAEEKDASVNAEENFMAGLFGVAPAVKTAKNKQARGTDTAVKVGGSGAQNPFAGSSGMSAIRGIKKVLGGKAAY